MREIYKRYNGEQLAQLGERIADMRSVVGSSPTLFLFYFLERRKELMNRIEEKAVMIVLDYLGDDMSKEPSPELLLFSKENFLKNSCRKWVAYEIIAYIKKYPWENPVKSLKRFSDKMLKYSKISKTDMSKYFLIAHDMAEEILRIFEDIWGLKG